MKNQRIYILMISLPNCPSGRLFKQDIDGDFFHSMSDNEVIKGKLHAYKFSKKEIESNHMYFERYDVHPESMKFTRMMDCENRGILKFCDYLKINNLTLIDKHSLSDSMKKNEILKPKSAFYHMLGIDELELEKELKIINTPKPKK